MINAFGWSPALQSFFAPLAAEGLAPARVVAHHRNRLHLVCEAGERDGHLAGRFLHDAAEGELPVVGDWVGVDAGGAIRARAPRRSVFKRKDPSGGVQAICANVDCALLVTGLDGDFNPRRIERYLIAARDGGAAPFIVLTKADLCTDAADRVRAVEAVAGGAPVAALSAQIGEGLDALAPTLSRGITAILLGSSGAGKSTLLNRLMGRAVMATGAVRADDDKGRHTTRHRELFLLPGGAMLIDAPGLRELALDVGADALDASFADIAALAARCRFGDCRHAGEPGCAIEEALSGGALTPARWAAYQKLQREIAFDMRRGDLGAEAAARTKWKAIHRQSRARETFRRRNRDWET
jgi:ribosome biogenesis GTPase